MNRTVSILMAAIFVLSAVTFVSCDKINVPGNVAGQVMDESGKGRGYTSVALYDAETGSEAYRVTSDEGGTFFIEKVDPGTYDLKVIAMGGKELAHTHEQVRLSAGKTLQLTVTLVPEE